MKVSDALTHFGTKANLAKALGIDRSAVTLWGEVIPKGRQYELQVLTKGKLKAEPSAA